MKATTRRETTSSGRVRYLTRIRHACGHVGTTSTESAPDSYAIEQWESDECQGCHMRRIIGTQRPDTDKCTCGDPDCLVHYLTH